MSVMTTDCRCAGGGGEGLYAVGQWWRWGDSWEEDKGVVEVRMYIRTCLMTCNQAHLHIVRMCGGLTMELHTYTGNCCRSRSMQTT